MLRRRPLPITIRTALIIPCTMYHARHVPDAIAQLQRQTLPPHEISIAISECTAVPPAISEAARRSPIPVRIRTSPGVAYAGKNRNIAVDATDASANLLIYQDADDLSHPQRVEVLTTLFRDYQIDHLMHHFERVQPLSGVDPWAKRRFQSADAGAAAFYSAYGNGTADPFHNGNNATSRALFHAVRWPEHLRRGQDVAYNRAVNGSRFASSMARLTWPLVAYRQHLSSIHHAGR
jgi:Glycosyl transferase family 2